MNNFKIIFKTCLLALSMFVVSCSKTEMDELNDTTTANQYQQSVADDDISIVGTDLFLGEYLDEISNQIRTYKKINPTVTDEELDVYANKIINNPFSSSIGSKSRAAYTDMDAYISGRLNSREQSLYNSNKAKALLCLANGKLALDYAASNYINSVLHNGNGDAFRHTLWNFGMTVDVGSSFAKTWSDAHEYGSSNQPAIEQSMDLFNNGVGIQLGRDNPNTFFHSTFISKSKEKVSGGRCYMIFNNRLYWSTSSGQK